jgi:hypothetical protein
LAERMAVMLVSVGGRVNAVGDSRGAVTEGDN